MKKRVLSIILAVIMIGSLLAGCGSSSASTSNNTSSTTSGTTTTTETSTAAEPAQQTITLRMSTGHSEDHVASATVREFASKVEEQTNGAITFKIYYANTLGSQDVIVNGLMDGSIDLSFEYLDATYAPASDIAALPFIASNYEELEYLFSPGSNMYSMIEDSFAEVGVKLLGIYVPGFSGLATKNIPENYNTCEPKSRPIRIWNSNPAIEAYQAMGYNCVAIDWSDTYTSIQTGIVDGCTGQTAVGVYTFVRDIVNYYIPYMYGPDYVHLVISQKTFDSLTAEQQDIITEAARSTLAEVYATLEDLENESMAQLESVGIEILPLTDEERNAIATEVRAAVWPSQASVFGQEALDAVYADLEACSK